MTAETTGLRCRAGHRCADAETITNPDTGEPTDRLGAVIDHGDLCDECLRNAAIALRELPTDVLELSTLLQPSGNVTYSDPDMPSQPRVKKAAPLPFDEYTWTLIELIDYETGVWAESVADHDGLDWDTQLAQQSRVGARVNQACHLLYNYAATLARLPAQEHRAHSLTDDPAHGHNADTTTRYRGDYWANREGWEALLRFTELHRLALRRIGKTPARIAVPCPHCQQAALVREQHNDRVICRNEDCEHAMTDDEYDAFLENALKAHGSPGDVLTRSQAAELAGVKPGTIKKWVERGHIKPLPGGGYRRVALQEFLDSRARHADESENDMPQPSDAVASAQVPACPEDDDAV